MITIGIDVGGTQTRAAAIDQTGSVLANCRRVARTDGADRPLLDTIIRMSREVRDEARERHGTDVDAIGIAVAGIVDRERGVVLRSVNLPALEGRRIVDALVRELALRCALVTDADAATWAEYLARAPRSRRFVHLRLGTGIACGVVINGKLQILDTDRKTHLEALIVNGNLNARTCRCGMRGCLETIVSGVALGERAQAAGLGGDIAGLQVAWNHGDRAAIEVMRSAADALAQGFRNLAARFQPEVISVGGGVATRLPGLLAEASSRYVSTTSQPIHAEWPVVENAVLGDDAGPLGAALLAMRSPESAESDWS